MSAAASVSLDESWADALHLPTTEDETSLERLVSDFKREITNAGGVQVCLANMLRNHLDAFHTFLSGLQDPTTTYQCQPLVQWEEGMPDMLFKIQDLRANSCHQR